MTELKPCPFCGNPAVRIDCDEDDFFAVLCDMGRCAGNSGRFGSLASAVACWNNRVSPWRSLKDDPPEPPTEATNHAILIRNLGRELVDNRYHQLVPYNDTDNDGVLRWFEVHLDWVLEDYIDRGFSEWMAVPQ